MKYLTASLEDYVEMIYILGQNNMQVGITDVAEAFGVSKAGVSKAVKSLKSKDLVMQEKYGKINLTPSGTRVASMIYEKHLMISKFLTKVLGVDPKTAEIDACKIEHILSPETVMGIKKLLKNN